MKKIYLLFKTVTAMLLTAMIGISGVNAQEWDAPSLVGEQPVSETTYFIYNLGCNGYLNRGANWGTMATVSEKPYANASTAINMWTCVNTSENYWTFQYNNGGSNVDNNYLFAIEGGSIYTDNSSYNTYDISEIDADNHVYRIQVADTAAFYVADQFVGAELAPEETNRGIANAVRHIRTADDDYINWIFVSQANYDLYQAKMEMHKYMTYAKMRGDIDLTSYIATYNADVIDDINTAIGELLTALNRTDVTSSITDPGFANGLADWTNDGFVTNDWTTPIGFDRDGILIEKWVQDPGSLEASSITQTLTELPSGFYALAFSAHAVQQGGANPLHTGAFLKCGEDSTEVSAGGKYWVDHVHVTDGELTIGYVLTGDNTCNWTALDDFELYYYGDVANTDATLSDIALDAGTLTPAFDPEITNYFVTIPDGTTSITVTPSANDETASVLGGGAIDVSSGEEIVTITVTAEDISVTKTYTVTFSDCFEPYFTDRENLVVDALCLDRDSYGGWGDVVTTTDVAEVYCGTSSFKLGNGATGCDAALDINPFNYKANTTYRVRAMLKTLDGSIGFLAKSADPDYNDSFDTNGEWQQIDFNFSTGDAPSASFVTFNKCDNGSNCTYAYIDNYEIYEVNNDGLYTLTANTGTLSPELSSDVTEYELIVEPGTASVTFSGTFHESASVEGLDEEITLTDGVATATITVHAESGNDIVYTISITSESSDATLSNIEITEGTILDPAFDSATSNYIAIVPEGVTSVTITPTKGYDAATVVMTINEVTSEDGVVDVTSGAETAIITVTAENGVDEMSYVIDLYVEDNSCYTPYYDDGRTNYVPDPNMDDMSAYTNSWGNVGVGYGDEAYCGVRAGKVSGQEICWPNGGSITTPDIPWKASTAYRVRAMVKTVDGSFTIGMSNVFGDGKHLHITLDTSNEWEQIDSVFTTSAEAITGLSYFNNCEGATGLTGYIDNWEIFEETSTGISETDKSSVKVYPTVSASGEFTVETSGSASVVTVYDLSGKVVSQQNAAAATQKVNVNAKGIYILKVECDSKVEVFKVFNK